MQVADQRGDIVRGLDLFLTLTTLQNLCPLPCSGAVFDARTYQPILRILDSQFLLRAGSIVPRFFELGHRRKVASVSWLYGAQDRGEVAVATAWIDGALVVDGAAEGLDAG